MSGTGSPKPRPPRIDRGFGPTSAPCVPDPLVVVHLDAATTDDPVALDSLAAQVGALWRAGTRVVVVHDGAVNSRAPRRVAAGLVAEAQPLGAAERRHDQVLAALGRSGLPVYGAPDGVVDAVRCRPATPDSAGAVRWIDAGPLLPEPGETWSIPVLPGCGITAAGDVVRLSGCSLAARLAGDLDCAALVFVRHGDASPPERSRGGVYGAARRAKARGVDAVACVDALDTGALVDRVFEPRSAGLELATEWRPTAVGGFVSGSEAYRGYN